MRKLLIGLTILSSMSSFAGSYYTTDNRGTEIKQTVGQVIIENGYLVIMPKSTGTVCDISLSVLKQLGIDPLLLGKTLKNTRRAKLQCKQDGNKILNKEGFRLSF